MPESRSRSALAAPDSAAPAPFTSHSTQVEQSRAVAQVEMAMLAAKRFPRDEDEARRKIVASCRRPEVYSKAFYRFPKGRDEDGRQNMITGPSIHLMREVARLWGNIDYGVAEIQRHDYGNGRGESEMLSQAWDMEANVRPSTVYRVPWAIARRDGTILYLGDDPRDVYNNNANQGARRTRAMLEAVIPRDVVALAEATCRDAIRAEGRGVPIETQRTNALAAFEQLGVTQRQIEDKLGRPAGVWGAEDMLVLRVIHESLTSGETTVGDEFAPARRRRAALDEQPDRAAEDDGAEPAAEPAPVEAAPVAPPAPAPAAGTVATPSGDAGADEMTVQTAADISAWFERYGLTGQSKAKAQRRLLIMREVMDMPDLAGIDGLGEQLAAELLNRLSRLSPADLERFGIGGGE